MGVGALTPTLALALTLTPTLALALTPTPTPTRFVTLLTDERFDAVFRPPLDAALLSTISDNPDPNIKLMTMNVAMSTATELVHAANGDPSLALDLGLHLGLALRTLALALTLTLYH